MATLYRANGEVVNEIEPNNGTDFELDQLYTLLDVSMIEVASVKNDDTHILICDEEALMVGEPVLNRQATKLAGYPIYGNALYCLDAQLQ